jgi:hypothetical protein
MERENKKEETATNREKGNACMSFSEMESADKHTCPYCGLRFNNPLEVIQHVFRFHSA